MKVKKFLKYTLLLFFFFFAIYFVFCFFTNYNPSEVLSPEPQAVLNINRPKKVLTYNDFIFEHYPDFAKIKKFLPLIPDFRIMLTQLAFGPVLVVDMGYFRALSFLAFSFKDQLLKPKEESFYIEENLMLSKQDPDSYILKYGNETLGFVARKKNLLIISPFLKALQMAIAHLSMEEKSSFFNFKGDIALYFKTQQVLLNLYKVFPQLSFLKEILKKNQWGQLRIDFSDNLASLNLHLQFDKPITEKENILAQILSLPYSKKTMAQEIPLRSGSFVSLNLDFQEFYKLLSAYFRDKPEIYEKMQTGQRALQYLSKKRPIEEVLFNWLNQEMGAIYLSGASAPLFLMRITDYQEFNQGFQAFIGDVKSTLYDYPVYAIKLPGMYQFLKNLFAPSVQLPYFLQLNKEYLLFANSLKDLETFLKIKQMKLAHSDNYQKVLKGLDKHGQIHFYADLTYGMIPLAEVSPLLLNLIQKYHTIGGSVSFHYPHVNIQMNLAKEN